MRITQSTIALQTRHEATQTRRSEQSLRIESVSVTPPARPLPTTTPAGTATEAAPLPDDRDTLLLKMLVRMLSGRELQVTRIELDPPPADTVAAAPPPGPALGIEYRSVSHYAESEALDIHATGSVETADGRRLRFALTVQTTRHFESTTRTELQAGQRKDPLVIVLGGGSTTLGERATAFDIDADGSPERIAVATGASAFVALDRNGNGRIDDGRELFGTQGGDGFAELALFDEDGNGFIDGGDSVFRQLLAWRKDANGRDRVESLAALGVGALALGSVAGDFAIRGTGNAALGQVRASGVYLAEDGTAGLLQQVDLVV